MGYEKKSNKKQETGVNWNAKCFGCVFGTYTEQILVPEGVESYQNPNLNKMKEILVKARL